MFFSKAARIFLALTLVLSMIDLSTARRAFADNADDAPLAVTDLPADEGAADQGTGDDPAASPGDDKEQPAGAEPEDPKGEKPAGAVAGEPEAGNDTPADGDDSAKGEGEPGAQPGQDPNAAAAGDGSEGEDPEKPTEEAPEHTPQDLTDEADQVTLGLNDWWRTDGKADKADKADLKGVQESADGRPVTTYDFADLKVEQLKTLGFDLGFSFVQDGKDRQVLPGDYVKIALPEWMTDVEAVNLLEDGKVADQADKGTASQVTYQKNGVITTLKAPLSENTADESTLPADSAARVFTYDLTKRNGAYELKLTFKQEVDGANVKGLVHLTTAPDLPALAKVDQPYLLQKGKRADQDVRYRFVNVPTPEPEKPEGEKPEGEGDQPEGDDPDADPDAQKPEGDQPQGSDQGEGAGEADDPNADPDADGKDDGAIVVSNEETPATDEPEEPTLLDTIFAALFGSNSAKDVSLNDLEVDGQTYPLLNTVQHKTADKEAQVTVAWNDNKNEAQQRPAWSADWFDQNLELTYKLYEAQAIVYKKETRYVKKDESEPAVAGGTLGDLSSFVDGTTATGSWTLTFPEGGAADAATSALPSVVEYTYEDETTLETRYFIVEYDVQVRENPDL
ncbi:MAG: hypothetical protein Q4D06_06345 [Coriobacteriia bacterium]|nr:hypothetical protein [Coriobacteriia bacterium]